MDKPLVIIWVSLGLACVVLARMLIRLEDSETGRSLALPTPFDSAIAGILCWLAVAGLVVGGTFQLGLIAALLVTVLSVALPRYLPASVTLVRFYGFKFPLAILALIFAIIVLLGAISHYEGLFYA